MKSRLRLLFLVTAVFPLANCNKPTPAAGDAPVSLEADSQLAEARDALQRQALEIETKTALMDKQLAEMAQSLKDRDNAELRSSLDALTRQNEALRVQAETARQQSNAITQRIAVAPQPNVVPQPMALPDYSLFYDRLEPFGRWFEVNGYGYCWRPTITVAGWRPYVDGCWVWSSLGWAWQSNEPFGWATYHYGRWVNLARYGWIWVPGSDWAPAWVAWRQSRDCVGWAPLPPEQGVCSGVYRDCDSRYGLGPASYTFINTTQFVSPTYINIYAPVTRQTTIFQHSVNVTQIVPSHSQGHAFIHQGGPPRGQIEQACGQPLPQRQVQSMHADQMPTRSQQHGRRDVTAPVAMVDLPSVAPGGHMRRPEIKEHIQKPVLMGGFEGVPQQAAREIRQNIAQEKETAVVQQQPPMRGHMQHAPGRRPVEPPTVVNAPPAVPNALPPETVNPASASEKPGVAPIVAPVETATATVQPQPGQESMPQGSRRHSPDGQPATNSPAQETVRPAVAGEPGADAAREPRRRGQPGMGVPQVPNVAPESKVVENSAPAAAPSTPSVMPAVVENKAPEPSAAPVVPVVEPERTAPPAVMPQPPAESSVSQQPVAAEAERTRMHAGREQAQAAAMEQRRQQEMLERGQAEKRAAEQAAANAEAEKSRMQATAAQQEALAAQQQRMAADQAAAETEKARQQAATTAAQQQQEMAAQQQRATAERMASEQAAAAETERVRQQTEAAAMQQRQQEEATRRAAEEQQMKAQQETERRTQEMAAQRQVEEQARRQQEAEMQRAQEQARRAAEEQQMRAQQEAAQRAQEMAQRQAEEQARRQQEAEMQRAQEQARRAAEEQQMRAQQEAAQRAQEMAQRQAEEQARRAQEMAQRQAEEQAQRAAAEAAQRAAAEAARNQPQPAPGS